MRKINKDLAEAAPAPFCIPLLPLVLHLIFLPQLCFGASFSPIMLPSSLIMKTSYFIHVSLQHCKRALCIVVELRGQTHFSLEVEKNVLGIIKTVPVCVLCQMRQVSQAKRWDDLGPGRHTLRQSRVIESLDFPDEEFGVNLGIVSVWSLIDNLWQTWSNKSVNWCILIYIYLFDSYYYSICLLTFFFPKKDTMAIKKRSSRTRRIRPVSSRLSEWPSAGISSHGGGSRTRTSKNQICH